MEGSGEGKTYFVVCWHFHLSLIFQGRDGSRRRPNRDLTQAPGNRGWFVGEVTGAGVMEVESKRMRVNEYFCC